MNKNSVQPNLTEMENEIEQQQRNVGYDTKEYTIEIICDKYLSELENEQNEFFVPEYQREFVWDDYRQSKFIESLMMGLPIPYIFLAENSDGRCEIVDGSQRIRTLAAYITDQLKIIGLEKLTSLNGLPFSKLSASRQRKFKNISLKMIVLSEHTTDETKNDIFERINRGSDLLKDMEKRKGIYRGEFNNFIYELAKNDIYRKLTPIAHWFEQRQEREELLLRFFAFSEWYPKYKDTPGIAKQLDKYLDEKNHTFSCEEKKQLEFKFNSMINFASKNFPNGFAKKNIHQVARPYFEALSVGTYLALEENPKLKISSENINNLITNPEFLNLISGRYQTHKSQKILYRINYIKNGLIKYAE